MVFPQSSLNNELRTKQKSVIDLKNDDVESELWEIGCRLFALSELIAHQGRDPSVLEHEFQRGLGGLLADLAMRLGVCGRVDGS